MKRSPQQLALQHANVGQAPQVDALGKSETGRIRLRGVRFQTPNPVSSLGLIELRGANAVSSFYSLLFVCKRELTEFFAELTEFAPKLSEAQ